MVTPPNRLLVPVHDLGAQPGPGRSLRGRPGRRRPGADQQQRGHGDSERGCVGGHGGGRARQPDQGAAQAGAAQPGPLRGGLELAVAVDEMLAADQLRQVALVGDVEEHRAEPG
jgi:hypothetical protein